MRRNNLRVRACRLRRRARHLRGRARACLSVRERRARRHHHLVRQRVVHCAVRRRLAGVYVYLAILLCAPAATSSTARERRSTGQPASAARGLLPHLSARMLVVLLGSRYARMPRQRQRAEESMITCLHVATLK